MTSYRVPVTIADKRVVTVQADSAEEARAKVQAGRYRRLGRTLQRGFLLVGEAERIEDAER